MFGAVAAYKLRHGAFQFSIVFPMQLLIGLLACIVYCQRPSTTTSTSAQATTTSTPSTTIGGTPDERAKACTDSSNLLVAQYKTCFAWFPNQATTTQDADNQAWNFVKCVCQSEWRAGSTSQIASSIPVCPAIPGISKGRQAAVASDCATGQSISQQMRIIASFNLRTNIKGKSYVPLSGLPPGVTSGTTTHYSPILLLLLASLLI